MDAAEDDASVDEALVRALEDREELLRQLHSHRSGWGGQTVQGERPAADRQTPHPVGGRQTAVDTRRDVSKTRLTKRTPNDTFNPVPNAPEVESDQRSHVLTATT